MSEIQQPACWQKTVELVLNNSKLEAFLESALANPNRPLAQKENLK
jgi:hypothetical protein